MATSGAVRAGRAFVELYADNSRLGRGLRQAEARLRQYGRVVGAVGRQMLSIGTLGITPFALATKVYAGFSDQMLEVKAKTNASEAAFKALTEQAKELGRTTSFTAAEVAGLQTELGKAGFNPEQIEDATGSILNLARATSTDLAGAAGIAAATLRQFGLEAAEAGRIADALSLTANSTFNDLPAIGEALTYAGPVALDFNIPVEDTLALVGALGNIGVQGSAAGTAIRRLMTLSGAEAEKLQRIFGVSFIDASGNARPLVDSLDDVNEATKNLGTAARAAKFNEAFGLLGITGASAIGRSAGAVRDLRDSLLESEGVAAKVAAIMDSRIGGAFRRMVSAAEGVAIAVGEALEPELIKLANSAATVAGKVTEFVSENKELVVTLVSLAGGTAVVGGVLIALHSSLGLAAFALKAFRVTAFRSLAFIPGLLFSINGPARKALGALLGLAAVKRTRGVTVEPPKLQKPKNVSVPDVGQNGDLSKPGDTTGELEGITQQASLAGGELTHLVGTMASLSVGQAVIGKLGKSLKLVPAGAKLAGKAMKKMMPTKVKETLNAGGILKAAGAFLRLGRVATAAGSAFAKLKIGLGLSLVGGAAVATASVIGMRGELANLGRDAMRAFRAIGQQGGEAWAKIKSTASVSVSGIVSALKSGNIVGAFNVAMAGIKLGWRETLASFAPTWAPIAVSMKRWWNESSKLMKGVFGPAVTSVKGSFETFLKWFDGPSGMRSMNLTFNDIMGSMAKAYARTLASMEKMKIGAVEKKDEAATFSKDSLDTVNTGANKFWNARVAEVERGYQRLRAFFGKTIGADVDLEVELKNINAREAAANAAYDEERNQNIGQRDLEQMAAARQRKNHYEAIENQLEGQLAEIAAETERRNAEDAKAVAETEKAAKEAAAAAKAALEATIKTNGAALPDTEEMAQDPKPADDPKTGKSPFELLKEWKVARDERDKLKAELSGANRNGGVNPETGRTREDINAEYQKAREGTDDAMDGVKRARKRQEQADSTIDAKSESKEGLVKHKDELNQRWLAETNDLLNAENNKGRSTVTGRTSSQIENERRSLARQIKEAWDSLQKTPKDQSDPTSKSRKPSLSPTEQTRVRDARAGLDRVSGRFSGSEGTFSGRAASQLGAGSSVMNRVAKAAEETAEAAKQTAANTGEMKDKVGDPGVEAE